MLSSDELEQFRAGPLGTGPVQVTCGQVWEVLGLERHVAVPIDVTYLSVTVPDWPTPSATDFTEVRLRPEHTSDALLRLRQGDDSSLVLSPLPALVAAVDGQPVPAGPADAQWQEHAGKWAATLGGRVVATAVSPHELLDELVESRQPYDAVLALKERGWDGTPVGL